MHDHATPSSGAEVGRAHLMAVLSTILISTSFPVGKAITYGLDPSALLEVRFVVAAALFAPLVAWRYGLRLPHAASLARYGVLGGCHAIFFWCMFESLRYTSALNTSAIMTLAPGLSAVFGAALVGERLGAPRLGALAIAMIGALWVIFRGDLDRALGLDFNVGDLIFLAGTVALAANMPLVRLLYRGEPAEVMTLWTLVTAALWFGLIANAKLWTIAWVAVDISVYAGIVYLAVFTTMATFYLNVYCTLRIGPTRLNAHRYLLPTYVLGIDWALGHGLPPAMTLPGVLIVLLASAVIQSGARAEAAQARPGAAP